MLSAILLAATLISFALPPLHIWAGPLLIALYFLYPTVFWSAFGLTGLAGLAYLLRRFLP